MVVVHLGIRGNVQHYIAKNEGETDFCELGSERRHIIARGHSGVRSTDDSTENRSQDSSSDLGNPIGPEVRKRHRPSDESGKRNRGVVMSAADGTPGENQRDEYEADCDRREFR